MTFLGVLDQVAELGLLGLINDHPTVVDHRLAGIEEGPLGPPERFPFVDQIAPFAVSLGQFLRQELDGLAELLRRPSPRFGSGSVGGVKS